MSTIYKNEQAKKEIMSLYDEKLKSLNIKYTKLDIHTKYGRTRILKTGNPNGKPIVLLHGFNAGAPLTLEAIKELRNIYTLYAVDTLGQTTKSEEYKMNTTDDSYGIWVNEILENLELENANIIGISYGAFIAQKLITHRPERVAKCILVVPSGLANGNLWDSITKLTIPLIKFKITKSDTHLKDFIKAFTPNNDEFMFRFQKLMLLGTKLDTKIPTLLKKADVEHFDKPIYIITSSNDIFFPHDKIVAKSKLIFNNLKEIYCLKNSKHMPSKDTFVEIQTKVREWVD